MEKTVLVQLGVRNRPVTFRGGYEDLLAAAKLVFEDILNGRDIYLQMLDKSWGEYVDMTSDQQDIPTRAKIRAIEKVSYKTYLEFILSILHAACINNYFVMPTRRKQVHP